MEDLLLQYQPEYKAFLKTLILTKEGLPCFRMLKNKCEEVDNEEIYLLILMIFLKVKGKKVKLSLYQTVEVHRLVRCRGSHIF
jgi:hypothetical protein